MEGGHGLAFNDVRSDDPGRGNRWLGLDENTNRCQTPTGGVCGDAIIAVADRTA